MFQLQQTLPVATSQLQYVTLALSAALLLMVIVLLGVLWRLRGPFNALVAVFLSSNEGSASIAKAMRSYLTTAEGITFMEGVINGKVRRELREHNTATDAHSTMLREYATSKELTAGMESLRRNIAELEAMIQRGRESLSSQLAELGTELSSRDEKLERRYETIKSLIVSSAVGART